MPTEDIGFDPLRKFVRITRRRDDGFVELEYALGAPEIHVEMILPEPALAELLARDRPVLLDGPRVTWTADDVQAELAAGWRLGDVHAALRQT